MRKIFTIALCVLAFSAAHADSLLNTAFTTTSGDIVVSSDGLTITFSDGNLVAANNEETRTFSLSDVTQFYFTSAPTGITNINADQLQQVEVFTITGQRVGCFPCDTKLPTVLGKGVYVVKDSTKPQKLIVR